MTVRVPSTLGREGRKLWREITSKYTLRPDELKALEDACSSTDMLADFHAAWVEEGRPYTSKGSMGQLVEHPLIGSIDKQRKARQAFLGKLKLPDDGAGAETNQQRSAAQTRWKHGA